MYVDGAFQLLTQDHPYVGVPLGFLCEAWLIACRQCHCEVQMCAVVLPCYFVYDYHFPCLAWLMWRLSPSPLVPPLPCTRDHDKGQGEDEVCEADQYACREDAEVARRPAPDVFRGRVCVLGPEESCRGCGQCNSDRDKAAEAAHAVCPVACLCSLANGACGEVVS